MLARKMLAVKQQVAANQTLYQVISSLGLTSGLKLCLDAGDSASYDPAVQTNKWLDTSGGGYDLFRGSVTGSDAADPTFNGAAGGISSSEYWSFDGGDYFTYDTTNETWMNNLHKDNAAFSVFAITLTGTLGTDSTFFGTSANATANIGVGFRKNAANQLRLVVSKTGGTLALGVNSTMTLSSGAWQGVGLTLTESGGSGTFFVDGSTSSFTSTYTTPSASNATYKAQIGAAGNGANPIANGSRIGCFAVWEGAALTSTQLSDIHNAIKGRFGL